MKTFTFANRKGGVGKTTLTLHLCHYLREQGKKVLLLDLDSQGNLSQTFGKYNSCLASSLFHPETPELRFDRAMEGTDPKELAIITSDSTLALSANLEIVGKFSRVKKMLNRAAAVWDYAIIDAPPALDIFTLNALAAADYVIIPTDPGQWGLNGVRSILSQIDDIHEEGLNPAMRPLGVVFNKYKKAHLSDETMEVIRKDWPHLAITPVIPDSIKVNEANQHIIPAWKYVPGQASAVAMRTVIEQLWARSEGQAQKEVA